MAQWVIIVPQKSFTRCYGLFPSHDACMVWVRENQFDPEDVQVYASKLRAVLIATDPAQGKHVGVVLENPWL